MLEEKTQTFNTQSGISNAQRKRRKIIHFELFRARVLLEDTNKANGRRKLITKMDRDGRNVEAKEKTSEI